MNSLNYCTQIFWFFRLNNEFSVIKPVHIFLFVSFVSSVHFIFDFEFNQRSSFVTKTRKRVSNNRYFILNFKKNKEKFRLNI